MSKILVVASSVREGRVADKVLDFAKEQLSQFDGFEIRVADLKELPMPFFNSPHIPSSEDFKITDENVQKWSDLVSESDAVIFLVAEYNHSYTPVVKNAIDWLYPQWASKPIAFIGYGWVGGARAINHLRDVMNSSLSAKPMETEANLRFMKELDTEGNLLDKAAAEAAIRTPIDELKATLN